MNARIPEIRAAIWACERCTKDQQVQVAVRQQTETLPEETRLLVVATAPPHQRGVRVKTKALSVHTDPRDRLRAFLVSTLGADWDELTRRGLAVLHGVKCAIVPKSQDVDERQHQDPPRRVVRRCVPPHFAAEPEAVKPPVVLTLGRAALFALRIACGRAAPSFLSLPLKEFGDDDVFAIRLEDFDSRLIVTTHPFADRTRTARDLLRAARLAGIVNQAANADRLTEPGAAPYSDAMDWRTRITIEPGKRGGKPCIRGLRITVSEVLEYLASGMTEDEILRDFPDLTQEDIRACLAFAADRERKFVSVPPA